QPFSFGAESRSNPISTWREACELETAAVICARSEQHIVLVAGFEDPILRVRDVVSQEPQRQVADRRTVFVPNDSRQPRLAQCEREFAVLARLERYGLPMHLHGSAW